MSDNNEDRSPLVSGMMDRCGADTEESFRQGVLTPRQYRECLDRCATCARSEACMRLLEETVKTPSWDPAYREREAPDYCENKDEIAAQKERLRRAFGS